MRVRAPCTRVHGVSLRVAFTRDGSGHIGDLEMSVRRRACKRACTHACLTPLTTCYGTDTGRQGGCIHRALRSRVARTAQFAGGEAAAGAHGVWARCARPLRVVRACVVKFSSLSWEYENFGFYSSSSPLTHLYLYSCTIIFSPRHSYTDLPLCIPLHIRPLPLSFF